jgi:hypothetical protein
VIALLSGSTALAEPAQTLTSNPDSLSDAELDARVQWLTTTLDDSAGYAKLWQYGWTSGYTLGIGIGAAQAATTSKNDTRVNGIVTASKAVIGTTRLLLTQHPGRLGADPMRAIGGTDRASKLQQLAVGESQLSRVGERAQNRLRWQRHAGNVALNVIGGAFIFGFGDEVDAAVSMAVGIAVGELMIFTSPKVGEENLANYNQKFAGMPKQDEWKITLVPTGMGAAIRVDF